MIVWRKLRTSRELEFDLLNVDNMSVFSSHVGQLVSDGAITCDEISNVDLVGKASIRIEYQSGSEPTIDQLRGQGVKICSSDGAAV